MTDGPDGGDSEGQLSPIDDVRAAISALSKSDLGKLLQIADWFAKRCGESGQDFLQEAIARAWDGRRRCRACTPVVAFIAGIMKSLASQETEAKKAGMRPKLVEEFDDHALPQWSAGCVSPEHAALSRIEDGAILAEIVSLIADSEQLQLLMEGLCDGLRGKDLEDLLGVDTKGLAAARKMLQRRLASKFPERKAS
jgi:DNA-directed RNA polymerase specialized sigma24 family protein